MSLKTKQRIRDGEYESIKIPLNYLPNIFSEKIPYYRKIQVWNDLQKPIDIKVRRLAVRVK